MLWKLELELCFILYNWHFLEPIPLEPNRCGDNYNIYSRKRTCLSEFQWDWAWKSDGNLLQNESKQLRTWINKQKKVVLIPSLIFQRFCLWSVPLLKVAQRHGSKETSWQSCFTCLAAVHITTLPSQSPCWAHWRCRRRRMQYHTLPTAQGSALFCQARMYQEKFVHWKSGQVLNRLPREVT